MSAKSATRISRYSRSVRIGLLATTMLGGAEAALAQDQPAAAGAGPIEEITVTAQRRVENLQSVPVSIQAFSGKKLDQINATEFNDYVKFLPSVVYQTVAPSQTNIYMRGIAAAGSQDGNHSGPQPTVGVYLDEQPLTTILGQVDLHLYDISRIEALSGPQGTLFGASSESGTLRIITNKPDTTKFSGSYDTELDTTHGDIGHIVEGYVNVPISDKVAIRLVGYEEGDPGYIDNVHGTLAYTDGLTAPLDNAKLVKDNFNGVQTYGGRAALGVSLADDWTITPTLIAQDQRSSGVFGYNPTVGDLKVQRYRPDRNHDRWAQAALSIQGKISDFDVLYTTGYFDRSLQQQSDYSDYTAAYATAYHAAVGSSGINPFIGTFVNAAGQPIDPTQFQRDRDHFTKQTQELRISSPSDERFRFVAGLFYERQTHKIEQNYFIDGLAPSASVTGWPGTYWLTQQLRVDRDYAAYGQATYDLTDQLSITGGIRVFESRNTLYGYYGYGSGESSCVIQGNFDGAPCVRVNHTAQEVDATYKASLQYKIDSDRMVYATASSGYRPGGANRNASLPPYSSDRIYNYEIGWKTAWNNGQLRWNGALFWENWDSFQFAFLGPSSLTEVANAGSATIRGLETDLTWAVTPNLTVSGAGSFIDSQLDQALCQYLPGGSSTCPPYQAPAGAQLSITPAVKFNATARYEFELTDNWNGFIQQSMVYSGRANSSLLQPISTPSGPLPPYASFDFSAGVKEDNTTISFFIKNMFDERGQIYRIASCGVCLTTPLTLSGPNNHRNIYVVTIQPITFGIKFGQKF